MGGEAEVVYETRGLSFRAGRPVYPFDCSSTRRRRCGRRRARHRGDVGRDVWAGGGEHLGQQRTVHVGDRACRKPERSRGDGQHLADDPGACARRLRARDKADPARATDSVPAAGRRPRHVLAGPLRVPLTRDVLGGAADGDGCRHALRPDDLVSGADYLADACRPVSQEQPAGGHGS